MGAGGCNEEKYPSNGTIDYNLIEKIISKSLSSINWKYYIDDKFSSLQKGIIQEIISNINNESLEKIKSDISSIQSNIKSIESNNSIIESDISTMKSDISSMKNECASIKSDISSQ